MIRDSQERQRLSELWTNFIKMNFPRLGTAEEVLGDEAYVLVDADGYLAGLVDSFLKTGRIKVADLGVDVSAHHRSLERLSSEPGTDLQAFVAYARAVDDLAVALSRASGVPLNRSADSAE